MGEEYDDDWDDGLWIFVLPAILLAIVLAILISGKKPDKPQFTAEQVTASEVFVERNQDYYNSKELKQVDRTKTYIHLKADYKNLHLKNYVMIDSLEYIRCQMDAKIRSEYQKDREIQSKIDSALQNNCN